MKFSRTRRTATTTTQRHACKPAVERLEDRQVLSGFVDHFEAPTIDPWWNQRTEISGSMSLSKKVVFDGVQALQMTSTNTGNNKSISLTHKFATPTFGRVSVWVYDTGADKPSSNYIYLGADNSTSNWRGFIVGYDYDLGQHTGGDYIVGSDNSNLDSGVDRTQRWRQFVIDDRPGRTVFAIDGKTVYTSTAAQPFDSVNLAMFGPSWRPAWVSYFDDFVFTSYGSINIVPPPIDLIHITPGFLGAGALAGSPVQPGPGGPAMPYSIPAAAPTIKPGASPATTANEHALSSTGKVDDAFRQWNAMLNSELETEALFV